MEDNRILYQIKTLEKMVFRELIKNKDIEKYPMIPPTQFQIIEYMINNHMEEIFQKDLENILELRRATVSGVLQTMEKHGLIKRSVDEEDTRTKKIILQDSTKEMFNSKKKKMKQIEKIIIKDISKEDLKVFSEVLEKMKNNIEHSEKIIT